MPKANTKAKAKAQAGGSSPQMANVNDNGVDDLVESTRQLTFAPSTTTLPHRQHTSLPRHTVPTTLSTPATTPTPTALPTAPSPRAAAAKLTSPPATTRRMPILYTPAFSKHRAPPGHNHPECPERLDVCVAALQSHPALAPLLDWTTPQSVSETDAPDRREEVVSAVRAVHENPDYLKALSDLSKRGGGGLGSDTYVGPQSFDIALLAASAWMEAVDLALGAARAAWALTRPPGHHATPVSGMGFCLLSNAAIAAKYALDHKDISSVAILDFDVHHGNGTEASVKNDARIRFASSHQWPLYPMSGPEGTTGKFDNVLNINLEEGTGIESYRARFEDEMLPFLLGLDDSKPKPELVIVSAGFDALDVDPLAQLDFKPADYRLFTELLLEKAGDDVRVVFGLEGGYNLGKEGLSAAVTESIAGYCLPNITQTH